MKIHIQKPFYYSGIDNVRIYVIDEVNGKRSEITLDRESKYLKSKTLDDTCANQLEPFLELPENFFNELVKAVVNYAFENNVKTENEHLLEGKLKATEKHLEDLRMYFGKALDKITT
jgi:hypothetical protein